MAAAKKVYTINVQLKGPDKRLLDRLVKMTRLPQTEVIRLLIRQADTAPPEALNPLKLVANG